MFRRPELGGGGGRSTGYDTIVLESSEVDGGRARRSESARWNEGGREDASNGP